MSNKIFWACLFAFFIINILLYLFIFAFRDRVPFNAYNYKINSYHYFTDGRIDGKEFNFLRALGQYDAQWYLKIANVGYPPHPSNKDINDKKALDGLTYAFFPLYPILISVINFFIKNVELSAFLISNLLMLANFVSLYFVVGCLYTKKIAIRTIFLLFLFPFSIFYRSYFTEGLLLLELIWFSYWLLKKKWLYSSVMVGALTITRGTGLFMIPVFLFFISKELVKNNVSLKKFIACIVLSLTPFLLWIAYCFINTGNGLYFFEVRKAWLNYDIPIISNIAHNLSFIAIFYRLPVHSFHFSQLDILTILIAMFLLIKSKKQLKFEFWLISFTLWLGPLVTTDTMSFTRYQVISFPLFVYLAQKLSGFRYVVTVTLFLIGLFFVSLLFVNWFWIG